MKDCRGRATVFYERKKEKIEADQTEERCGGWKGGPFGGAMERFDRLRKLNIPRPGGDAALCGTWGMGSGSGTGKPPGNRRLRIRGNEAYQIAKKNRWGPGPHGPDRTPGSHVLEGGLTRGRACRGISTLSLASSTSTFEGTSKRRRTFLPKKKGEKGREQEQGVSGE